MDKKKQMIEEKKEIAKELDKVYPNAKFTNGWIAEVLYKLGYRKIPENAVVLTREEYERQQKNNEDFDKFARSISDIRMKNGNKIATFKDLQDYIELQVKQGGKETAEKFAERLKEKAFYITTSSRNSFRCVSMDDIDETCKEIAEGKV